MGKKGSQEYVAIPALLIAALAMAAAVTASSHNLGTLVGTTTDVTTGQPLEGVNVSLLATSASNDYYSNLSDSEGDYIVSNIEPANYDISTEKEGYMPQFANNQPVNPFQTIRIDFNLSPTAEQSGVYGYVTNATSGAVANATVIIAGANKSASTNESGYYLIENVTAGTYDMVASKRADGYEDAVTPGQELPGKMVNFTLLRPSRGCNDDCTMADGLCHSECQGKGLCSFYSQETRDACNFASPGITNYGEKSVMCCTGAPYTPIKANPAVSCGGDAISIRIPVLFKGRLATMVLTVFDAIGCSPE